MPNRKKCGTLVIIGGREEKEGEPKILREIAARVGDGKLCIATVASSVKDEHWESYRPLFRELGIKRISHLDVVHRHEAVDYRALRAVEDADAIFFTGGDQLKITSELGGTLIAEHIHRIYNAGGLIAGTSAGASVMSETMLVGGMGDASYRIGSGVRMAPGLGFVQNIIIDQHFSERGRIGRLLGAVAQNPKFLGIGIDENTAILMEDRSCMKVFGSGSVCVIDAHEATDSNISEADPDQTLSVFNVKFHVLSEGDEFEVIKRTPFRGEFRPKKLKAS